MACTSRSDLAAVDDNDDDDNYGLAVSRMNGRPSSSLAEPQATATSLSTLGPGTRAAPILPDPVNAGAGLAVLRPSPSMLADAVANSSGSSQPSSSGSLDMLAEQAARATRSSPSPSNNMDATPIEQSPTPAPSRLRKRNEAISLREEDSPEDELNADGSVRPRKKAKATAKPRPRTNAGAGNGGAASGGTRRQGRSGSKPTAWTWVGTF